MKLLAVCIACLAVSGAAFAQSSGSTREDQTFPTVVVPEIIKGPSVGATLAPNRHDYANGVPVYLHFVLTNPSKSSVKYQFADSQKYDVAITDSTDATVWRWSKNKVFGQLVTNLTLDSGQSAEYTIVWNQRDDNDHPVPAGVYTATATLIPMDRPQVSGNLLANQDNDPVNTGMPLIDSVQSGAVRIKNTTPPVYAKTTFTVDPAD